MKKTFIIFIILTFMSPLRNIHAQSDTVVSASGDITVGDVPSSVRPMHLLTDKSKLTADSLKKWDFHLSMGTSFIGGTYSSASLYAIRPTLIYRPSDRWTIKASASAISSYSFMPGGYTIRGNNPRSLAPTRYPASGAVSASVSAAYKVNDRLSVAAAICHIDGQMASGAILNPWCYSNQPVDLNATSFTAAMRYQFADGKYLNIHMTFIDDRTGALGPYYFGNPYAAHHAFDASGWFHFDPIFDSQW